MSSPSTSGWTAHWSMHQHCHSETPGGPQPHPQGPVDSEHPGSEHPRQRGDQHPVGQDPLGPHAEPEGLALLRQALLRYEGCNSVIDGRLKGNVSRSLASSRASDQICTFKVAVPHRETLGCKWTKSSPLRKANSWQIWNSARWRAGARWRAEGELGRCSGQSLWPKRDRWSDRRENHPHSPKATCRKGKAPTWTLPEPPTVLRPSLKTFLHFLFLELYFPFPKRCK